MGKHFGVRVSNSKYGLKLRKDKYAIINNRNSFYAEFRSPEYTDESCKFYTEEWCENHRKNCLENFDLNIKYFKQLDHNTFNKEIRNFLKKYKKFKEVKDLSLYNDKSGYYIMVLDSYSQIYIGTSKNIKKRIRTHWRKNKSFDRLLLPIGAVNTSIMSIDSFRALDTTRIFAYITTDIFKKEDEFINFFSEEFLCNRMSGGILSGGLLEAIGKMKNRNLD